MKNTYHDGIGSSHHHHLKDITMAHPPPPPHKKIRKQKRRIKMKSEKVSITRFAELGNILYSSSPNRGEPSLLLRPQTATHTRTASCVVVTTHIRPCCKKSWGTTNRRARRRCRIGRGWTKHRGRGRHGGERGHFLVSICIIIFGFFCVCVFG